MTRRRVGVFLVAVMMTGILAPGRLFAAPSGRGQPYVVTGVVLNVGRGLLSLRLDSGGSAIFRLVEGTILPGGGPAAGRFAAGARVQVWAHPVPEGPPVALRVILLTGAAVARVPAETGGLRGVVVGQNNATVSVLGDGNVITTVLITGTTVISGGAILPRGVVQVEGTRNSDGSISARAVIVLFDPRTAARVGGRIAQQWAGIGFTLADGSVVTLGDDTWIVRGTVLRTPAALVPGVAVTVLGVGSAPYIAARVVEIAP